MYIIKKNKWNIEKKKLSNDKKIIKDITKKWIIK
jgi:hypothetical protein